MTTIATWDELDDGIVVFLKRLHARKLAAELELAATRDVIVAVGDVLFDFDAMETCFHFDDGDSPTICVAPDDVAVLIAALRTGQSPIELGEVTVELVDAHDL